MGGYPKLPIPDPGAAKLLPEVSYQYETPGRSQTGSGSETVGIRTLPGTNRGITTSPRRGPRPCEPVPRQTATLTLSPSSPRSTELAMAHFCHPPDAD